MKNIIFSLALFSFIFLLTACGFHLQSKAKLAEPLHRMYIQATDPYSHFVRYLEQYLKMSDINLVTTIAEANTLFVIMKDEASQELLSVSSTQQTRQYNLKVTVIFQITDTRGRVLIGPQVLSENRVITVQASQILGSSNETNMIYQQMRRMIAYAIINRLTSNEVTKIIEANYPVSPQMSQKS
jgi:LPS-assembly lipoprotein